MFNLWEFFENRANYANLCQRTRPNEKLSVCLAGGCSRNKTRKQNAAATEKQRKGWPSNLSRRYNARLHVSPAVARRISTRKRRVPRRESRLFLAVSPREHQALSPPLVLEASSLLRPVTRGPDGFVSRQGHTLATVLSPERHWFILFRRVSTVSRCNCAPLYAPRALFSPL